MAKKKAPKSKPVVVPSPTLPSAHVGFAAEAKRTGKSLDELQAEKLEALKPKVSPDGEWFRLASASLNGTPYLSIERLTVVDGELVAEMVYGPNMRDYCVGHIVDYIESSLMGVMESKSRKAAS